MSVSRRRRIAALTATAAAVSAALVGVAGPASATPARTVNAFPKVPGGQPCCGAAFLRPGQAIWRLSAAHPTGNSLRSVGLSDEPGGDAASTALAPYLVLQNDGNLVEYETGTGKVLFNAGTRTAQKLVFQSDRNVVLYDGSGHALWSLKRTVDTPSAAFFGPYGNGELATQKADGTFVAWTGTAVTPAPGVVFGSATSPDGTLGLTLKADGNLVEYSTRGNTTPHSIWQTGTIGSGPSRLVAQRDGNLVMYSVTTGKPTWSTHTESGTTAYRELAVQDDGQVVLWSTDGVNRTSLIWSNNVHA